MAQNISWLSNLLLYNISEETRQIDLTSFNSDNFAGVDNMASDGSNVSHHTQVQVSKWDATGMMHLGGNQERYLDEMPTIF